jgi:hypothetical protein
VGCGGSGGGATGCGASRCGAASCGATRCGTARRKLGADDQACGSAGDCTACGGRTSRTLGRQLLGLGTRGCCFSERRGRGCSTRHFDSRGLILLGRSGGFRPSGLDFRSGRNGCLGQCRSHRGLDGGCLACLSGGHLRAVPLLSRCCLRAVPLLDFSDSGRYCDGGRRRQSFLASRSVLGSR